MKTFSSQTLVIIFSIFMGNLVFESPAHAQTAAWVDVQLPGIFPANYHYDVGETCMIFADDTSSAVYAFDIYSGDWQVLLVPTKLDWQNAAADGNIAMVYNDSIIVAYSALTSTFSAIVFSGNLANLSAPSFGCIDNFAYFVTDQLFYVFDAEEAHWRSFSYTSPGAAQWGGGVRGKEDYIYLDIWIANAPAHTMAAYSIHTKTFDQLTEENIYNQREYDHGFTFFRGNETPYLCGGYSAYTGQFVIKTHSRYITESGPSVFEEMVSPIVCSMFVTNEQISGNIWRYYMWVYNTIEGNFAEYSFEYTYNGSNYVPVANKCGGQHAMVIIRNVDEGDKLECLLYEASTNTFSLFDTPLFDWGNMSFSSGGLILDGFDKQNFFMYDVETASSFTNPVYWTQGFFPDVEARPVGNYWNIFAYREQSDDTIHVFSYNRQSNNLHTFDIYGGNYAVGKGGSDFYRILVTDMSTPYKMHLYSPNHDTWMEKDLSTASSYGGEGNYCYINYPGQNQILFYDGQANQEHWFSSSTGTVLARDSVFFMYAQDGKYIGYSLTNHAYSEFVSAQIGGQLWNKYIVLVYSQYDQLVYDAFNNLFLPLTLSTEHGVRRNAKAGGKTALVMSQNGYLFAYYPGEITGMEAESQAKTIPSVTYKLSQNYPNPFNPTTLISFSISKSGKTSLKIYDILGQEVKDLVSGTMKAGEHTIEFDATGLASGIYLYQLVSGDFIETKKMIKIK